MRVGAVDDAYEREADAVAGDVVARLNTAGTDVGNVADGQAVSGVQRRVQRKAGVPVNDDAGLEGEADQMGAKAASGAKGGDLDENTSKRIESLRGKGNALPGPVRAQMEASMNADFGDVRVHTGGEAASLAQEVGALAFTQGNDIFFAKGLPDVSNPAGLHLLSHELTHVVQQAGGSSGAGPVQRFWGKDKTKNLATAAANGKAATATPDQDDKTVDNVDSALSGTMGTLSTAKGGNDYRSDITKATQGKDATVTGQTGGETNTANIGAAAGAADFLGMFVTIAKSVKTFKDPKKEGADKAGAALELVQGASSGASGLTNVVDGAAKAKGMKDGVGASDAAGKALGGITDMFGTVKEVFYTIKGIVELAEKASEMSDEEKFKASMDIVRHSLEAAKSGVSMVKGFLDLANSGVSAATVNVVPGLGIAIGCAELVVRGYDTVVSTIAWADMRDKKREMKGAGNKGKSWKAEALRIKGDASASEEDKEKAEEYLTAKSLQYINGKRIRRALLKIGVAMTKIAGDATTLGGVSAPVGIGLKIGAVVLDAGAGLFRNFKQAMRDKVAADPAGNAKLAKIFSADKSTTAKLGEYNRIVDHVFVMIEKAAPAGTTPTKPEQAKIDRVGKYISAMGFSVEAMYRDAADGSKLRLAMIDALKKRE